PELDCIKAGLAGQPDPADEVRRLVGEQPFEAGGKLHGMLWNSAEAVVDQDLHDIGRTLIKQLIASRSVRKRYPMPYEGQQVGLERAEMFLGDLGASHGRPKRSEERINGTDLRRHNTWPVMVKLAGA